jgi:hypothetical protein
MKALSLAKVRSISTSSAASRGANRRRAAIWIWVSSSASEPRAIERKRKNSLVERRAAPSAMLDGTLTALRRSCEVRPKRSWSGNAAE